jgi:Ca2+:H+ antiporter
VRTIARSRFIIRLLIWVGAFWSVCFLSIIPLEKLFDWCGEQMTIYLGLTLGDLLAITLNNAVEATLAIILLSNCE